MSSGMNFIGIGYFCHLKFHTQFTKTPPFFFIRHRKKNIIFGFRKINTHTYTHIFSGIMGSSNHKQNEMMWFRNYFNVVLPSQWFWSKTCLVIRQFIENRGGENHLVLWILNSNMVNFRRDKLYWVCFEIFFFSHPKNSFGPLLIIII